MVDSLILRGDSTPRSQRAVSPIIGVILLVAITVIISAVLATSFIQMTGEVESASVGTFEIEQSEVVSPGETSAEVSITYVSGNIEGTSGELQVRINGEPVSDYSGVEYADDGFSDPTAGTTVTLIQTSGDGLVDGDRITVITKKGSQTVIHTEETIDGINVGSFSFSHKGYSAKYPAFGGDVDFSYSGRTLSWDRITVTLNGKTITTSTTPELTTHGSTLEDGDTTSIQYEQGGEVSGTVRIYYTDESGQQVLIASYDVP